MTTPAIDPTPASVPWTANIDEVARSDDQKQATAVVTYANGTDSATLKHDFTTKDELYAIIAGELARRNHTDEVLEDPPLGPVDLTPPTPSDDDQARAQFVGDLRTLRGYLVLVEAGVVASDAKRVTELRASVVAQFAAAPDDATRDVWAAGAR